MCRIYKNVYRCFIDYSKAFDSVDFELMWRICIFWHTNISSLLIESLHDSRPMLGAGSSSGVELFQVFMGTGLWQDGADQHVFHGLFIPTFAHCLSILVESPFLHKGFASRSSGVRERPIPKPDSRRIETAVGRTGPLSVQRGVRHDCPHSPLLSMRFYYEIEGLCPGEMGRWHIGVGGKCYNNLICADDVALLATTEYNLQQLVKYVGNASERLFGL